MIIQINCYDCVTDMCSPFDEHTYWNNAKHLNNYIDKISMHVNPNFLLTSYKAILYNVAT